jgi:hypothetical protein
LIHQVWASLQPVQADPYLQDCPWAKKSRADIMHLTPKDEDRLLLTVDSLDLHAIFSPPAAFLSISQSNSLCEKASIHETALQSDQFVEWIGR